MNKKTLNHQSIIAAVIVATLALIALGIQQAQALLKKTAAEGNSIRVSEHNTCAPAEDGERPNFSGCNSLI